MRIGILGAGNAGGALGQAWARAGHEILFGVRKPSSEREGLLPRAGIGTRHFHVGFQVWRVSAFTNGLNGTVIADLSGFDGGSHSRAFRIDALYGLLS